MEAAPIGLFVFDRLEHVRKSIDALKKMRPQGMPIFGFLVTKVSVKKV